MRFFRLQISLHGVISIKIFMQESQPTVDDLCLGTKYLICDGDSKSQTGSSVPTRLHIAVRLYCDGYTRTGLSGALTMAMRPSDSCVDID